MNKKGFLGTLGVLPSVAIILVVTGIIFALGLQVLGDTQDDMTSGSWEYNATESALEGVAEVPSKFPTIGVAIAAVVVIAIVASAFAFAGRRR
jgi:hypothetical protein